MGTLRDTVPKFLLWRRPESFGSRAKKLALGLKLEASHEHGGEAVAIHTDRTAEQIIDRRTVGVPGGDGGTSDVAVDPALMDAPSGLLVEDVLSAFAGSGPSVFAGLFCFRALKQAMRSALCSMARQRSTSSFVAA